MKNTALIITAMAGLALGTPSFTLAEQVNTTSAKPGASPTTEPDWSAGWQRLESEMDNLFHDTVAKFKPDSKEATFSSSVYVREKPDAYVARIYLWKNGESAPKITFENGVLHVVCADKGPNSYDESIGIPGPVKADEMKIDREKGIVVVTLPKETKQVATAPAPSPALEPANEGWDQEVVRAMQGMQDRMDQLTRDLTSGLPKQPVLTQPLLFASTVNMENDKDKYVVHFYLPDRDLSNVKADVNGDKLRLTASEEANKETTTKVGSSSEYYSAGEYSQVITLPGPVHADQMKIERKEGTVTVTLPKA